MTRRAPVAASLQGSVPEIARASTQASPPLPERTPIAETVLARHAAYFQPPRAGADFRNPWPHPKVAGFGDVLRWKTQTNPLRGPGYKTRPLTLPENPHAEFLPRAALGSRLSWIGHASFLFELDQVRFVIDPIFGRAGGLVRRVTPAAIGPEQLTDLAAVLLTHGHHDHFDPGALRQLALANQGRALFIVPQGMGRMLPRECRPYVELEWWQFVRVQGVRVHFVPAQHWHQRGPFDLNRALWGGFVLEGTHRVYHSGDTSYFGGFAAIGAVFAGIDAACLPLGAFEPRWFMASQHMNPDESLAALADLAATHFVGMHWAAYDLSDEPLTSGAERALALAPGLGLGPERMHVILPGGSVSLEGERGTTRATTVHRFLAGAP